MSVPVQLPTGISLDHYPDGSVELCITLDAETSVNRLLDWAIKNRLHQSQHQQHCQRFKEVRHLLIRGCDENEGFGPSLDILFQALLNETVLPNLTGIYLQDLGVRHAFPIPFLTRLVTPHLKQLKYLRVEFSKLVTLEPGDFQALAGCLERQALSLQSFQMQDCLYSNHHPAQQQHTLALTPVAMALATLPVLERVHIRALPPMDENGDTNNNNNSNAPMGGLGDFTSASLNALCRSTSLRQLTVQNFELQECHLLAIAQALSPANNSNCSLDELELSYSYSLDATMAPKTWALLAQSLSENPCLEVFRLGLTQDPNPFLKELAQSLALYPESTLLKELAIYGGDGAVNDETAKLFLKLFESGGNSALQWIQLPRYYGKWMPKIDLYLKLNRTGLRKLVQNPQQTMTTKCWVDVLTSISNDLDCTYYLLREDPVHFFSSSTN